MRPRLSVFRSNKHIYAQIIDDTKGETLVSASDFDVKKTDSKKSRLELAFEIGKILAERSLKKKVKMVKFDRGRYKYHGIIKQLAEGARGGGLKF